MMVGFPPDLNSDELTRVYETCFDLDLQPMTVMAALLRTEDEVFSLILIVVKNIVIVSYLGLTPTTVAGGVKYSLASVCLRDNSKMNKPKMFILGVGSDLRYVYK